MQIALEAAKEEVKRLGLEPDVIFEPDFRAIFGREVQYQIDFAEKHGVSLVDKKGKPRCSYLWELAGWNAVGIYKRMWEVSASTTNQSQ